MDFINGAEAPELAGLLEHLAGLLGRPVARLEVLGTASGMKHEAARLTFVDGIAHFGRI